MAPGIAERNEAYSKAIVNGYTKRGAAQQHAAQLAKAKATIPEKEKALRTAKANFDALKLQPVSDAALAVAKRAVTAAQDDLMEAQGLVSRLDAGTARVQAESFSAQVTANDLAKAGGSTDLPFPYVDGFESPTQAASMDPARYAEVIGGKAPAGKPIAGVRDMVASIKAEKNIVKQAHLLAGMLKNVEPVLHRSILRELGPELESMAGAAAGGQLSTLQSYAQLVKAVDPELRADLAERLAKKVDVSKAEAFEAGRSGDGGRPGFSSDLRNLLKSGEGAELVAPLLASLRLSKPEAAKAVANNVAKAMTDLRKDFTAKHKVAADAKADLARLVYGFKDTMTPAQLEAAVAKFKQRHEADFAALDSAVNKSMGLVRELEQLPSLAGLEDAKAQLKGDLPLLLGTRAGANEIKAQLQHQVLGNPSWLDNVGKWAGDSKTLASLKGDVAKIVVKTAASLALSGKTLGKLDAQQFLTRNMKLLNLDRKTVATLSAAMKAFDVNTPSTREALDEALKGVSTQTAQSLRGLSMVLSLPGVIASFKDFGDKEKLDKASAVVGALQLGTTTAEFIIEAFANAESLDGLKAGAGVAGKIVGGAAAVLSGINAAKSFADGQIGDGVANGMSAVGGLLMLGGPGGVAAGAVLTLGGVVVKAAWGSDPAADAEAADEADAKAFLEAGGVPPKLADAFSDLRRSDRRNMGTFVGQLAESLNMKPADLMKHLATLDRNDLEAIVKHVKLMKADDDWKYPKSKVDTFDRPTDSASTGMPKSIETMTQWMRARKLLPSGK